MNKVHVKKGDTVVVTVGRDRGKRGKVIEVSPKEGKVIVEGVNIITKHVKPRKQGEQGGLVKAEAPLYACKVMLYCSKCSRPVRARRKLSGDGEKSRECVRCGAEL